MSKDATNALWVSLSEYGEGNIFHVYPKLLSELLKKKDEEKVESGTSEAEKLVLPSNKEWRIKKYFTLVALQKTLEPEKLLWIEDGEHMGVNRPTGPKRQDSVEPWAPWNVVVEYNNARAPAPVRINSNPEPPWDIAKVLLAAKLLIKPPCAVHFQDEQEMRCVYSLIYDVFRYKAILDEVIWAVDFFANYPQFRVHKHLTWLFVMELARRHWDARPRAEAMKAAQLLKKAGSPYCELEQAIWKEKVHFAAAISKIRIKQKAFCISELLPQHLRDERVSACVHKETVTGWVNTFKERKLQTLVKKLNDLGYSYSNSYQLCAGEYRFDRVCPRFITLFPLPNISIGKIDLVRNHIIVLQEREFCEGASTLCRMLKLHNLTGVVAQTHGTAPRCSAYLAAQLRELAAVLRAQAPPVPVLPELGKLVVFGVSEGTERYVRALRALGVDASTTLADDCTVTVLKDPIYAETAVVTDALECVVAVLATPPNSYSAVTDPIDLVCGRGGDLTMLEILTDSEVDNAGKSRAGSILEEQQKTLKAVLSKPQVQLVLYETHSVLEAENQAQVIRAVSEANRLAKEHHILNNMLNKKDVDAERGDRSDTERSPTRQDKGDNFPRKTNTSPPPKNRNDDSVLLKKSEAIDRSSKDGTTKARPIPVISENVDIYNDVVVPKCDLFQMTALPNLGNGLDINYILSRDGVYLGLIQRKEFTKLDAKYMIKVAEDRGLFGGGNSEGSGLTARRKRAQTVTSPRRRRRKTSGFEVINIIKRKEKLVERIAAPTHASLQRSVGARRDSAPATMYQGCECERHLRRQAAAVYYSGACSCDWKHKRKVVVAKVAARAPTTASRAVSPTGKKKESRNELPCREPFPVTVHDIGFSLLEEQKTGRSTSLCATTATTMCASTSMCASPPESITA